MRLLDNTGLEHLIDIIKNAFTNVEELIAEKVDKVDGKVLSSNDYTTTEKNKLSGIETGAQKNTVTSVNGKTGAVTLSASDVGALPSSTVIPTYKMTETRTTYTTTTTGIVSRSITGYDASTCTLDVYINGIHCIPGVHYNISGTTVTTVNSLQSGQVIHFVLRKVTT